MADNSALALRQQQQDEILIASDTPPELTGTHIPPGDWLAMSHDERQYALTFFREELKETLKGLKPEFPRIKYPASGSKVWMHKTADGRESMLQELEMVVIFKHHARAWWEGEGEPQAGTPPKCKSNDAIRPVPGPDAQSDFCATCRYAAWGSGKKGVGQACKSVLNVFGLFPGQDVPTVVRLPPTGIRPFSDYAMLLRKESKKYPGGLLGRTTRFVLKDATNKGGIRYTGVEFLTGSDISYQEMIRCREMARMFDEHMRGLADEELRQTDDEELRQTEMSDVKTVDRAAVIDVQARQGDDVPF